jgi:hypothetical protein
MFVDNQNLFSKDQAVTVTAASTNVIDLGIAYKGEGEPINILAQVTTAFAGGTSVAFKLQTDDNASFNSATDVQDLGAIATATLVQGYKAKFSALPSDLERYVRLYYTVVGTMSAGAIFAGLNLDEDSWRAMADAI